MGQALTQQDAGQTVRVLRRETDAAALMGDRVLDAQVRGDLLRGPRTVPDTGEGAVAGTGHLVDGAVHHDAAGAHEHDPVGEVRGLLEEVRGEDDGATPLGLGLHRLPELLAGAHVHAGGGLVEQQQVRFGQQGEREAQPLLLAAGALAHLAARDAGGAGALQRRVDGDVRGVAGGDHGDGFADGQVVEQAAGLEHGAHATGAHGGLRGPAQNGESARGRGREPQHHVEERGLAGAVGTQERDDLAALDLEVDAGDRMDGPRTGAEVPMDTRRVEGCGRGCCVHASSLGIRTLMRICRPSPIAHDICQGCAVMVHTIAGIAGHQ